MSQAIVMLYPKRRVITATQVGIFLFLLIFSLVLANSVNAQQASSISGSVFEDLNLNQTFDLRESGLTGWTVNLYRGGTLLEKTTSNTAGRYSFNTIEVGSYTVKLEVPNTWAPVSEESVAIDLRSDSNIRVNFANYKVVADQMNITGPYGGMSISNQNIEVLSSTSVKITWFTNRLATSQVVFGKTSKSDSSINLNDNNFGYISSSVLNFETATFHTVILKNLSPSATYNYRLVALPNPIQWRGAARIFSSEFRFITHRVAEENLESKAENDLQIVRGVEFTETTTSAVMVEEEEIKDEDEEESIEKEKIEEVIASDRAGPGQNCPAYIWILLILNTIAIVYTALKSKDLEKKNMRNAWWILSILVVVPVILGYAECWLVIWLLVMLIVEVVVLFSLGNKDKQTPV